MRTQHIRFSSCGDKLTRRQQTVVRPSNSALDASSFFSSAAALAGVHGMVLILVGLSILLSHNFHGNCPSLSLAAKCARRGYADTLRQEVLMYSSPTFIYTVHCALPNSFVTDTSILEQQRKLELTKHIESARGGESENSDSRADCRSHHRGCGQGRLPFAAISRLRCFGAV